jgi:hypothetical protein
MTPLAKKLLLGAAMLVFIVILLVVVLFMTGDTSDPAPVAPVVPAASVPKFERKFAHNFAIGINPGESGGGGNITYLGKANGLEACEAKCAENTWCNAYTSFDSHEPYNNDCFGMRVVPTGQDFSGNGWTVSGVKL